jgi:hypothetical protein
MLPGPQPRDGGAVNLWTIVGLCIYPCTLVSVSYLYPGNVRVQPSGSDRRHHSVRPSSRSQLREFAFAVLIHLHFVRAV